MESKIYTVYVENISDNGSLNISTPDGSYGTIPCDEVSRLSVRNPAVYVGNELKAIKTGDNTYSSRLYEEEVFISICEKFCAREQNVYYARFLFLTSEGKVAIFELATGVIASLSVNNFAFNRIDNFYNVRFPKEYMPVCITEIRSDGKIFLSTVPVFGSFAQNVERLGLKEGDSIKAFSGKVLPDGNRIMAIAPNLAAVVNYAKSDSTSELLVRRIDFEFNRLKCDCLGTVEAGTPLIFCSDYIFEVDSPYIDVPGFLEENKAKKRQKNVAPHSVSDDIKREDYVPPVFETDKDKRSPFSIFDGEALTYYKDVPASLAHALRSGRISADHITIARVVDTLKYTTVEQVHKYLYLTTVLRLSRKEVSSALHKLAKVGVLDCFYFVFGAEKRIPYLVFTRGINFRKVVDKYISFIHTAPIPGENSVHYKNHMAQNQLLIHLLREPEAIVDAYGKLDVCEGDERPLFTAYKVVSPTHGVCYLEAARKLDEEFLFERLSRYSLRLSATDTVVITLEDEEHMVHFEDRVREMELGYRVLLTWDTNIYSDVFAEIAPHSSKEDAPLTFFRKILKACS